jgi:Stress responsive A/B Barrel Domain
MYSVTRLVDVADGNRDRILRAMQIGADNTGARHRIVEPTLPGSRNGGDILAHLRFDAEEQWRSVETDFEAALADAATTRINGACYSGDLFRSRSAIGNVYRTLLLRVLPGTDPDTVARFEEELALMPRYVNTITAWQLSRVEEAIGTSAWTHVFEQEFTSVEGLMGPYLMHPIHWAVVDRWFDPETTDVIIKDRVCHSFCALASPILC